MKHDALSRRLALLEARQPSEDQAHRAFLSKLTDEELHQLEKACIRTQEWKLPLTDEESLFIEELRAKYGHT